MQGRAWIEVAPHTEVARLNLGNLCERLGVTGHPRRYLAVGIGPRVVQHAHFQAGDASPRCFALHFGCEKLDVAVGPGIVAVPGRHYRAGESLFGFLFAFRGGSSERLTFIHPFLLPRSGRKRDSLFQVAGPLHHRADRPPDIENDAPISADARIERLKPVPERSDRIGHLVLLEPIEVDLKPAIGVD